MDTYSIAVLAVVLSIICCVWVAFVVPIWRALFGSAPSSRSTLTAAQLADHDRLAQTLAELARQPAYLSPELLQNQLQLAQFRQKLQEAQRDNVQPLAGVNPEVFR